MVDESYLIRCPGCGNTKRVEMAVGQQLQCDVCQTKFFAPVVTTEQRPASEGEIVHDSPLPLPSPQTTELVAGVVDSPARLDATPPTSAETPSRGWRLDDSTAPPPGSTDAPLADARPVEQPARDVSPPADLPEPAAQRAPRTGEPDASGRIWTWISALAGVVIVGVSAAACAYLLRDWVEAKEEASRTAANAPVVRPQKPASANLRWSDASRSAQIVSGIQVQIVRVSYGAIRVKDINNQVITTEDDNLLAVTISVYNRSSEPCPFHNWYTSTFGNEAGEEWLAELTDNQTRAYSLLRFDDVSGIEGQRWTDRLEPQQTAQDTIVFLIPPEIDCKKIKYFRLSLPAAAVGFSDVFRFEIPVGMIDGF